MQVTNDGATILKAIGVDNPAAKILCGLYPLELYPLELYPSELYLWELYHFIFVPSRIVPLM